jgi:hypothetical protein
MSEGPLFSDQPINFYRRIIRRSLQKWISNPAFVYGDLLLESPCYDKFHNLNRIPMSRVFPARFRCLVRIRHRRSCLL